MEWKTEYIAYDPKTECSLRVYKAADGEWHWAAYDDHEGGPIPPEYIPWDAKGYDTFTEACMVAEKTFNANYSPLFEAYHNDDTGDLTGLF